MYLCPLVLRREGKLEILQECYDHNLHLKDALDNFSCDTYGVAYEEWNWG